MSQHLIIKNNAVQPCTPVCLAVTCDETNPSNYAITVPVQKILYNRNQAEAVGDFIISIDLPFWLGCNLLTPTWAAAGSLGEVQLRFIDILASGAEGAVKEAVYEVTLTEQPYSVSLSFAPISGCVPFVGTDQDFVGCRYVVCLISDLVLTAAGGFELCAPIDKACDEACGRSSACSKSSPDIICARTADELVYNLSTEFPTTGEGTAAIAAVYAWTQDDSGSAATGGFDDDTSATPVYTLTGTPAAGDVFPLTATVTYDSGSFGTFSFTLVKDLVWNPIAA